jgi:hypothetical protein
LSSGKTAIILNSQALASEISDESRFIKNIAPPLMEVRSLVGDGLFTVGAILLKENILTFLLSFKGTSP